MSSFKGIGIAIAAVVGIIGLIGMTGIAPGFAVVCTQNCQAGVSINFSITSTGTVPLAVTLTDTSTCIGPCYGTYTVGVTWGDTSSSIANNGGSGWSSLPTGAVLNHNFVASGKYTITESIVHLTCAGGRTGYHCFKTTISGQEGITVGSAGGGGGSVTQGAVNVSFAWNAVGKQAFINDTTVTTGSAVVSAITLNWGDGTNVSEPGLGFFATHAYSVAGTYSVVEFVTWLLNNTREASSNTATLNITSGGPCACGGGGAPSASSAVFIVNALTVGLLVGGFGTATIIAVPGSVPSRTEAALALCAVAVLFGWWIGGLGSL